MAGELVKGASEKFAESFGSGLAYGIVAILAAIIIKYTILNDVPIIDFTEYSTVCKTDGFGNNCIVGADCPSDSVAIGGECTITDNKSDVPVHIQNFGLYGPDSHDPKHYECNWVGPGDLSKVLKPRVRAACVKRTMFGPLPSFSR